VESVQPLLDERRHTLTLSIPPETLPVKGDPARLEQVVINLLTNAAKYTEAGGHLGLTAEREGENIVIRIRDTGIGIPAEKLHEIFDLFAQGDRSLARSEGGLGIGLTVVKRLVEMHGGSVTAQSEGPGQGSEFVVRLPASEWPLAETSTTKPSDPAVRRGAHILIVDDNADTTRALSRLL